MNNPFSSRSSTLNGPGTDYLPLTPHDTDDLPEVVISVYAQTGGDVTFVSARGEERMVTLPDFGWLICGVRAIRATGTTATGLHGVVIG